MNLFKCADLSHPDYQVTQTAPSMEENDVHISYIYIYIFISYNPWPIYESDLKVVNLWAKYFNDLSFILGHGPSCLFPYL